MKIFGRTTERLLGGVVDSRLEVIEDTLVWAFASVADKPGDTNCDHSTAMTLAILAEAIISVKREQRENECGVTGKVGPLSGHSSHDRTP